MSSKGLGERLREVRNGLSQMEFGKRIGVSQGSVRNYELGERKPAARILSKICQEFGVSAQWLLLGVRDCVDGNHDCDEKPKDIDSTPIDNRDELIAALRENAVLLRENGELKLEVERLKNQNAELQRENARLITRGNA